MLLGDRTQDKAPDKGRLRHCSLLLVLSVGQTQAETREPIIAVHSCPPLPRTEWRGDLGMPMKDNFLFHAFHLSKIGLKMDYKKGLVFQVSKQAVRTRKRKGQQSTHVKG